MGDQKPTEQKEKQRSQPNASEAVKQQTEKVRAKGEEREAIQEKGVKERTSQRLEVLEEINLYTPDSVTAKQVSNINVETVQEDVEVKEALQLIGTITVPILAKFAKSGIDLATFDTPAEFKGLLNELDQEKHRKLSENLSNPTETATIKKLQEIFNSPQSRLYKNLEAHWGKFIKKSRAVIKEANEGIKGIATKPLKWVKENPGKAVLFAVGAYALYKIFTMEDEKNKKDEKKDWTDHIFNKKNLGLSILTIGAILGSGKLIEWLKKSLFGNAKEIALHTAEKVKEAAIAAFNKRINFDTTKNRLLKFLPQKPEWLKTAKLQNILEDMGIDPEKTAHLKKYSGPSGAALLLKDWMTRKHKVDGATQKILEKFLGSEAQRSPKTTTEEKEALKEYGEFVPLKDAWSNYGPHLEQALTEMKKWANENKELIGVAAIFLASFESIRDALKSGVTTGFDGFVSLAKLPWKAVKGFPMSSFFVVSAALLAANSYKDTAGNIMVPKDPENFKKYAAKRVEDAGAWAQDLPHVPHNHIDAAVEIIQTPGLIQKYLAPAGEMLEDVGVNILKMATLSPEELLIKTNDKGLYSFGTDLRNLQLDHPEGSEEYEQFGLLIKDIKEVRHRIKSGALVKTEELTQILAQKAKPLGINIFIHDGYIAWTWKKFKEGIPVLNGPRNIMVDPSLKAGDARKKAQRFVSSDTVWNAPGRAVGTFFENMRMFADDILFEDAKNMNDMTRIVDKKLNSGAYIAVYGGAAWLYEGGKGVVHRYALGPYNLVKHAFKGLTGDFSAVDLAVDYSSGLLPVMIMGTTASIARGKFMEALPSKVLVRSLAYPIKGLADIGRMGTHIVANIRNPHAIVKDPSFKVKSEYFASVNRWKSKTSRFRRNSPMKRTLKSEFNDLAALYEAKGYLHEREYKTWLKEESLYKKVQEALRDVEGINSQKIERDHKGLMRDIDRQIAQRELYVAEIEKTEKLGTALQKMKEGKTKQAERILEKMGYKTPATQETIQKELEASKKELTRFDKELNSGKRDKNPDRQKSIDEAEKSLGETKLSSKEKKQLIENIESSKKDLEKIAFDNEKAIRAETEKATSEGIKAGSPEFEKRMSSIKEAHAEKMVAVFKEKGLHNLDLLDDATLKEHGFDPKAVRERMPHLEAKVHSHGKIKKFGKGVVAFAAGLLTMYGLSKGLEWFHEEDKGFDIEKLASSETPGQKKKSSEQKENLRENVDQHKTALKQIQRYFSSMQLDYQKLNELLGNPKKLKNSSEETVRKLVKEASSKHKENINKIKEYVKVNRDAFLVYYERLPKAKNGKDKSLGQFFSVGFDSGNNRPYLKYADTTDFRDTYYEITDIYREHMDQLLKGEKIDGWDTAIHGAKYATPLYGTYLDGRDAVRAIGRGEWTTAAKSGGWAVLGGVSDALMVAGVVSFGTTTVAGAALKGVRVTAAGAKGAAKGVRAVAVMDKVKKAFKIMRESEKLAKVAKYAHTGSLAGMGADIGRQVFIPPKSQTYYF